MSGVRWSNDTRVALGLIGGGMRLRVPHDGGGAELREGWPGSKQETRPVAAAVVRELLASGLLFKLPEHRAGDRRGWRAAGYDGDVADWYVMIQ